MDGWLRVRGQVKVERQTDVVFFLFNKISQVEMDLLEIIPLSDRD